MKTKSISTATVRVGRSAHLIKRIQQRWLALALVIGLGSFAQLAKAQGAVYTVVNDDVCVTCDLVPPNHASVFINGKYQTEIKPDSDSYGTGDIYGTPLVDIDFVSNEDECIFFSDGGGTGGQGPGDIAYYNYATGTGKAKIVTSGVKGNGYPSGIALAHAGSVLVAGWTGEAPTLETFTIGSGCSLKSSKSSASGVGGNGGSLVNMAVAPNGKFVVATYYDGTYGYYPLSGTALGKPQLFTSNCFTTLGYLPTGIAISSNSEYVYLDCLLGLGQEPLGATIDAFAAADPGVTVTNGPLTAAGGLPVGTSATMGLSAGGNALYLVATYGEVVESTDVSGTSVAANSCPNLTLQGYESLWFYAGTINVLGAGAGTVAVVTEEGYAFPDSHVQLLDIGSGNCLTEGAFGYESNSNLAFSGASYLGTSLVPTTTTLTSSPNPSTYGESVTFTAVVSSSEGAPPNGETVSFMKGKTVLGTGELNDGTATFITSALKVGANSITAVYPGDSTFAGSTSNVDKQVVKKAAD